MRGADYKEIQTIAFCQQDIVQAIEKIDACIKNEGKIILCGDESNAELIRKMQMIVRKGFAGRLSFYGKKLIMRLPPIPQKSATYTILKDGEKRCCVWLIRKMPCCLSILPAMKSA